ncbi:MAG: hypothetical protein Q9221_007229 [Calogaya cf. arnoldii]
MASTQSLKVEKLFSVKDYVCVVSGGGTGIGLMITQALAANAKVYITGRRMEVLENAAKTHSPDDAGQIIPIGPCDVTSKEQLEKLVQDISCKEKHINLLVANAGIAGPKGIPEASDATQLANDLWKSESPPEWADVFNTNVTSVYFTTLAFLPLLQASQNHPDHATRSPSVIVISSMSGIIRNSQGHFAYNAAKGATVHLSKLMSSEFEKANIRVNSIAPGYFPSEMTAKSRNEDSNKSHLPDEKVQDKGHVPAERPGSDAEMGMAALFLCKNNYVNGQVVAVDGGAKLYHIKPGLTTMSFDPLDELLELENTFYKEGYDLGIHDGSRTGRIEGRLFGLTSAFEKFSTMGNLHGRSVIWSARLSTPRLANTKSENDPNALATNELPTASPAISQGIGPAGRELKGEVPQIHPHNPRLEKHIQTLYALTEPASLSTDNTEDAVSDFNDRLKRAEGKAKIIERLLDEDSAGRGSPQGDGDLEMDFTSSHAKPSERNGGIGDDLL